MTSFKKIKETFKKIEKNTKCCFRHFFTKLSDILVSGVLTVSRKPRGPGGRDLSYDHSKSDSTSE